MRFRVFVLGLVCGLVGSESIAGATLPVGEDASVSLGGMLQPMFIASENDNDGDGNWDSAQDFRVRRARLRLGLKYGELVRGFLQTEVGSPVDGTGLDARVIDAYVALTPRSWAQLMVGEHLAPANRQNITLSQSLLAMDRPGNSYKTLTWGTRAVTRFATTTFEDCDAGIRGDVDVRDTGATLFGEGSMTDDLHWKYHLGMYNGIQADSSDENRYTGRVQLNLWDSEPGYYVKSTYLGEIKTLGVGASYDTQSDVAECPIKGTFDYGYYTVDLFAELPLGTGSLSLETAYQNLDLDDARAFELEDGSMSSADPSQSQGDGIYVQAGYLIGDWQPWVEYENWDSDAESGKGSYDLYRIGLTYYIHGFNANIKAGWEHVEADAPMQGSLEDTLDTFAMGLYLFL